MTECNNPASIAQNEGLSDLEWLDLKQTVQNKPEHLDFVLPGFPSGTVGALISPGATGKTMFALQASVSITSGFDMLSFAKMDTSWQPTTTGCVIFLSGEDPAYILRSRIHAISQGLSEEQREAMCNNLLVARLFGSMTDIMTPTWQKWIADVTNKYKPRLVILDPLRRFHMLDENDGGQMTKLLNFLESLCSEHSTSILFLHHTSKAGALAGGDSQQASRGSSVLTDNPRFQANLIGMTSEQAKHLGVDEDARRKYVRLSFPKLNYSEPMPDRWFERGNGGMLQLHDFKKTQSKCRSKGRNRDGF